ncbi:carboxypeptidase-like regulatory domain-containing protein [Pigmentiphaga sp. GD03639]|uniref:carboxypeptidase-like regulatory domain-containing protein n=1 Tax=Pigmentiphaga sp. GD03639 TaxID=2975354 RepID=UPI00244716B7|nr:carboxypeptidase-like regulatory domain-containing protein [Pigmentiphaga sp. GD03639]MDH2235537.1 carboxypeptidase-like regulatory domain-containing protein [Pigmentiphaga sp. GD03639]
MKQNLRWAAPLALALALAAAWPLAGQAMDKGEQNGIAYVTGGVGQDESAAIRGMKDYSLRVLAAAKSGEYVADVRVAIRDSGGKDVLSVTTQGPYLLARLAPGDYRIDAEYGSARQSRQVRVPASGRAEVSFYF